MPAIYMLDLQADFFNQIRQSVQREANRRGVRLGVDVGTVRVGVALSDPDSILATRFDAVFGLVDLMETASRRLGDIRTPAILMYGAHDQIVKPGPMKRALERLRKTLKH